MDAKQLFAWALAPALLSGLPLLAAADEPATSPAAAPAPAAEGPRLSVFEGASVLHVQGACLGLVRCVGNTTTDAGTFLLPGGGSLGRATATWSPVEPGARRLRVSIGGVSAEGASPLELELGTLPPGRHAVRVEPTAGAMGAYDQRVDWSASFLVQEPASPLVTYGTSGYDGTRRQAGTFLAPWPANATLHAEWPSERALRWTVAGQSVEATSPLRLELPGLVADEHVVEVEPTHTALLDAQSARWVVVLER